MWKYINEKLNGKIIVHISPKQILFQRKKKKRLKISNENDIVVTHTNMTKI